MKSKKINLEISDIQRLAIEALFSDEYLLSKIVLKGGNALVHAHKILDRTSVDIDVSIRGDLEKPQKEMEDLLKTSFAKTFREFDFIVFDASFTRRPESLSALHDFWGGYRFEFKIISKEDYERIGTEDLTRLRRESHVVDFLSKKRFFVDFSKEEYCESSVEMELGNAKIVVYTPMLIVIEKLRAICQQLPEYKKVVPTFKPSARPRDFFDIFTILDSLNLRDELLDDNSISILKEVFKAKRVPIEYLLNIEGSRDFHEGAYRNLEASIPPEIELLPFGFYFDYSLRIARDLTDRMNLDSKQDY
jgi:hypothetical protein